MCTYTSRSYVFFNDEVEEESSILPPEPEEEPIDDQTETGSSFPQCLHV